MALIKCKECQREISSNAVSCPGCGAPVNPIKKTQGVLEFLKKIVISWVIIAIVFYAGFLFIQNKMEQDKIQAEATKAEEAEKKRLQEIKDKKKTEEVARLKAIEDKKKAEQSAMATKAAAEELEENLENAEYLSDKFQIAAGGRCRDAVEKQAKYDFEWMDSMLDTKFPSYLTKTKARGVLTVGGDKLKFQNGFGAWQYMKYLCDYDIKNKKVLGVRVFPR